MDLRDYQQKKSKEYFGKGILVLVLLLVFIQFIVFIVRIAMPVNPEIVVVRDTVYLKVYSQPQPQPQPQPHNKYSDSPSEQVKDSRNSHSGVAAGASTSSRTPPSQPTYSKWQAKEIIDINVADSITLLRLPGIGPFYAGKIVEYREQLGGSYAAKEQLLELWRMDAAKYELIKDKIEVGENGVKPLDLYAMPFDSMKRHPYIGYYSAEAIVRYRTLVSRENFSIDSLVKNNIISKDNAWKLSLYMKESPNPR